MEIPVGLGGVCDSPNTVFRGSYPNLFHNVQVARQTNTVVSERLDFSSAKCSFLQQIHTREMRQTNSQSSREGTCSGTAYVSNYEVTAKLRSAHRTIDVGVSRINVAKNPTDIDKKWSYIVGETDGREFATCQSNSQSFNTDLNSCAPFSPCHTHKLGPDGDAYLANSSPGFTSTSISETARELCNAVSVSLGLALESNEVSDQGSPAPTFSSGQSESNLFEVPLLDSGTEGGSVCAPMKEYRNPARDDKILGMFKSRPTNVNYLTGGVENLHDLTPPRVSQSEEFGLNTTCTALTKDSTLIMANPCYQFDQLLPTNLTNFSSAKPLPAQSASSPPHTVNKSSVYRSDVAETAEEKYYSNHCNKKIKSEATNDEVTEVWGYPYRYAENGPYRQTMHPYCSGAQPAFIPKPYDYASGGLMARERTTSEQWYASGMLSRMSYPTSGCVKNEVGQWLDMSSYTDGR